MASNLRRFVLWSVLLPAVVHAAPTGLNQIPTTDLVPDGQLSVQVQNGNSEVRGSESVFHRPQPIAQSQYGLPWNFEAGLDVVPANPPHDYRPMLNVKMTPLHEDYYTPAVAAGALQLGPDFMPGYYLVASKTLNYDAIQYQKFRAHHRNIKLRGIRVHTGVLGIGNVWHAMVGTDIEVNDHFVIYADWISAASNAVSLGGVLIINQHLSFQASMLRGNDQDRLTAVLANFTYTFEPASLFRHEAPEAPPSDAAQPSAP